MADIEVSIKALFDNSGIQKGKQDVANLASQMSQHYGVAERSSESLSNSLGKLVDRFGNVYPTSDRAEKSVKKFGSSASRATPQVERLNKGIGSANASAIEFSRIVQDAPYGLQGMANNLTQLSQNFANTSRQAGGTGNAIKAIWRSAITGPNLLVLGISLATSALVAFQMHSRKAKRETEDLTSTLDKQLKVLKGVSAESLRGEADAQKRLATLRVLRNAAEDVTLSMSDRIDAVRTLKKEFPDHLGNLSKEEILAGNVSSAYDSLTKSIIASAKARAFENKIAENAIEILAQEQKIQDAELKRRVAEDKEANRVRVQSTTGYSPSSTLEWGQARLAAKEISGYNKEIAESEKVISERKKQNLSFEREITKHIQEGADILKSRTKDRGSESEELKGQIGSLRRLNELKSKFEERVELAVNSTELIAAQTELTKVNQQIFALTSKIHRIQMKVVYDQIGVPDLGNIQEQINQTIDLSTNPWDKRGAESKYYEKLIQDRYKEEAKTASDWLKEKAKLDKEYDEANFKRQREVNRMLTRGLESGVKDVLGIITGINELDDKSFESIFSHISSGLTSVFDDLFSKVIADKIKKSLFDKIEEGGENVGGALNKGSEKLLFAAAAVSSAGAILQGIFPKTSTGGQAAGGALKGAGQGAIIGSAIAPAIGTAIGAVVGGITGLIGGIFGAKKAREQERREKEMLEEQKRQTALMERQNAMTFLSQIVGRMVEGVGVINNADISWDGQLVTRIAGDDLEFVLQRNANKKKTQ